MLAFGQVSGYQTITMKATSDMHSYLSKIRRALDESAIVAVTDPRGTITEVNDKFCAISQYSREELLGKNHRVINSGQHPREFFKDMWSVILSGSKWQGEICNRAKDGSLYWVHTHIIPFFDKNGQIQEFVSIRYDVTSRKNTELNLRSFLDSQSDGLLIYDLSGGICWTNQTVRALFSGVETFENLLVEDLLGADFKIFKNGSFRISCGVGESKNFYDLISKNYSFNGRAAYLLSIRDVTEKLVNESRVNQQERLASVGVMASGLAHEIGTPLGVIRGRAEMIAISPACPTPLKESAEIIMQQIDRVSGLVRGLLNLARGEEIAALQDVSVKNLLLEVVVFLRHELESAKIKIDLQIDESHLVRANTNSLFQVFLNLLVNSIHAIQQVEVSRQNQGQIRVSTRQEDDFVVIKVEDNGCGMNEEHVRKVFTPFFTTKEVGQGTGLGLATSYKIVQAWGGHFKISSTPYLGTSFEIFLPRP